MAWLLQRDSSHWSVVKFDMDPPCKSLMIPREHLNARGLAHFSGRATRAAIDIDDGYWPCRATLKTPRNSLPDWLGFCSFWGVSQSFRECIEAFEPDVHEFRPVEVLRQDGSHFEQAYYALNVRRVVYDAVDWNRTDVPSRESRGQRFMLGLQSLAERKSIVMRASALQGHHLWLAEEVIMATAMGVSDVLYEAMQTRKLLKGIASFRVAEI